MGAVAFAHAGGAGRRRALPSARGGLAIATALLSSSVAMSSSSITASAAPLEGDRDNDISWSARVVGTNGAGLRVRVGPGQDYPAIATLGEGTRIQVTAGPEQDRDGRLWYTVAGWDRTGRSGWSAAEYLTQIDPNELERQAAGSPPKAGTTRHLGGGKDPACRYGR